LQRIEDGAGQSPEKIQAVQCVPSHPPALCKSSTPAIIDYANQHSAGAGRRLRHHDLPQNRITLSSPCGRCSAIIDWLSKESRGVLETIDIATMKPKNSNSYPMRRPTFTCFSVYIIRWKPIFHIPFHTTAPEWEWDVGTAPTRFDEEQTNKRLEKMYRDTAFQVRDWLETRRGRRLE
jgi:hypothetical protein